MKLQEEYWNYIQAQLLAFFKEIYFNPIFELLQEEKENAASSALLSAIRHGRLIYQDGKFSGKLTIQISKELSKFAKFDKRSKTFVVNDPTLMPSDILISSLVANEKSKKLHEEINKRIKDMPANAKEKLKTLNFSIEKTADQVEAYLKKEVNDLGVKYNPSAQIKEKLSKQYNENMALNIVNEGGPGNWNDEQVTRLRDMIEKNAMQGYNKKNLIESIQNEFEISKSKSIFLARQETSLFLSDLQAERFQDSGIDIYKWSGSRDIRQVGNPSGLYPKGGKGHGNHWILNGKYCKFSDDSVYAVSIEDVKNNKWKSRSNIGAPETRPGIEFLCRCAAIPVVL